MGQEIRKATDVLLDLESKVDRLLGVIGAQDLNIKVLSNKLNEVLTRLDKQQAGPPRIIVETTQTASAPPMPPGFAQMPAGDPERNIPILAENALPQEKSPQGFRRNSRPESYVANKNVQSLQDVQLPVQLPPNMPIRPGTGNPPPGRGNGSDVTEVAPPTPTKPVKKGSGVVAPPQSFLASMPDQPENLSVAPGTDQIPVMQRCVDKNGKSIFLANVEIMDLSTNQNIFKTRTMANGKWTASLDIGSYQVTIRKMETVNKGKFESIQSIQVDGSKPRIELPVLIIK